MDEERQPTEIWLEKKQYQALTEMARSRGGTVSEMAHDLIAAHLRQFDAYAQAKRLEALERVRRHREHIGPEQNGGSS